MFYKQNGIVAGILLLILFAGAIGLVSVQMDKTVNRMHIQWWKRWGSTGRN